MIGTHPDGPLAKAPASASWTPVFELIGMILDQPISAQARGAFLAVWSSWRDKLTGIEPAKPRLDLVSQSSSQRVYGSGQVPTCQPLGHPRRAPESGRRVRFVPICRSRKTNAPPPDGVHTRHARGATGLGLGPVEEPRAQLRSMKMFFVSVYMSIALMPSSRPMPDIL